MKVKAIRWGLLWRSKNNLDGVTEHLINRDCIPALFRTRVEAREFANKEYGYILERKDLQSEPHGWKMPVPVRVAVEVLRKKIHRKRRNK